MKNTKITFRFTSNEDKSKPNNNYSEETDYIIVGEDYDFGDWLNDHGCEYEQDDNIYYLLDEDNERNGAAYSIVSIEGTDEDLID